MGRPDFCANPSGVIRSARHLIHDEGDAVTSWHIRDFQTADLEAAVRLDEQSTTITQIAEDIDLFARG